MQVSGKDKVGWLILVDKFVGLTSDYKAEQWAIAVSLGITPIGVVRRRAFIIFLA